jgi:choline kinase
MRTIFIPCAGLGSRVVGENDLPKALLTLGENTCISMIINKYSRNSKFVIALGYKGNLIEQYLRVAYPDLDFKFVYISKFEGNGSGLGITLLECKEYLQEPFILHCCDTIILDDIPNSSNNWMGYKHVNNTTNYRVLEWRFEENYKKRVISIRRKFNYRNGKSAYIGLAGIKDYEMFWQYLQEGLDKGLQELGETYALSRMLKQTYFEAREFDWIDSGNKDSLIRARNRFNESKHNVLPKENEYIWFNNGLVIKYHSDPEFIRKRVNRARDLEGFIPQLVASTENFYSYKYVEGTIYSEWVTEPSFLSLLNYLKTCFWIREKLSVDDELFFHKKCREFYKDKTEARIQQYFGKFGREDAIETINRVQYPTIKEILDMVDWDYLCSVAPYRTHGDMHFENIVIDNKGQFHFLDWRGDFAGLPFGDRWWDVAKLNHGLIVSHDKIRQHDYDIKLGKNISFEFDVPYKLTVLRDFLRDYFGAREVRRIEVLTALIFLNCAPLHEGDYCHLLFYLGKTYLYDQLTKD